MTRSQPHRLSVGTVRIADRRVRVEVDGELDLRNAPKLVKVLRDQAAVGHDVLLDLSAVSFIDSSGVRALVAGLRIARSAGRKLTLDPRLSEQAHRILEEVAPSVVELW